MSELETYIKIFSTVIVFLVLWQFAFWLRDRRIKKLKYSLINTLVHNGFKEDKAQEIFDKNQNEIIQMNKKKQSLSIIADYLSDKFSKEKSKTKSVSFRNNKQENKNNNSDLIKLDNVSDKEQSKIKSINNNKENLSEKSLEQITRITKVIDQTLDFQILLSGFEAGTLPEDEFLIGYLLGYSDSIQQWNDISLESTVGVTIMAKTFITQFGKERGLSIWRKYPLIGESSPKDLLEGAKVGGQDMHNFLMYGSEYSPMNLNAYLTGEEIYFKLPPKNS